jgi:uncharacterized protein
MLFVIIGHDKPNVSELRLTLREQHLAYVRQLLDKGKLLLGGPFTDGSGMLVVVDLENEAAVKEYCANDPFMKGGVLERVEIKPFRKIFPLD